MPYSYSCCCCVNISLLSGFLMKIRIPNRNLTHDIFLNSSFSAYKAICECGTFLRSNEVGWTALKIHKNDKNFFSSAGQS
jgi:hypothetical protein